jgi:hypothetical protein
VVVLVGVGVCTVSDVSVNAQGLVAAVIAVCGTALQQHVSIENVSELILFAAVHYMLFCWWASTYSISISTACFISAYSSVSVDCNLCSLRSLQKDDYIS